MMEDYVMKASIVVHRVIGREKMHRIRHHSGRLVVDGESGACGFGSEWFGCGLPDGGWSDDTGAIIKLSRVAASGMAGGNCTYVQIIDGCVVRVDIKRKGGF